MNLGKLATSFSRGLNMAASHTLNDQECQVSENFIYKDRSATVRKGYKVHAEISGGAPIVALEKFYQGDGDQYFCAVANGQVHYSITSGVFQSVSSDPVSGEVHHAVFDGALYFTDYSSPVKFFNGGVVGIAGLSSPTYRFQISDMEDAARWSNNGLGEALEDTAYMHREKGDKAVTFTASSPASPAVFQYGGVNRTINSVFGSLLNIHSKRLITRTNNSNLYMFNGVNPNLYESNNNGSSWTSVSINNAQLSGLIGPTFIHAICPIVSTTSGDLRVTKIHEDSPNTVLVYNRNFSSGAWSKYISINISSRPTVVDMAINTSNDVYIVTGSLSSQISTFSSPISYKVLTVYNNGSTSVSSLLNCSSVQATDIVTTSSKCYICIDRSNYIHTVMESPDDSSLFYFTSRSGLVTKITSGETGTNIGADVAVDSSSNIHVAFRRFIVTSSVYSYQIGYKKQFMGSGTWTSTVFIQGSTIYEQGAPSISIENNNKLSINWMGNDVTYPTYKAVRHANNLSSWVGPINIYANPSNTNPYFIMVNDHLPSMGIRPGRPNTGWAGVFLRGSEINYLTSYDIKWDGDPADAMAYDLTKFSDGVSSEGIDIIQLFTVPNRKDWISSLVLRFVDASNYYATKELTQTSAWVSVSNNEYGMKLSVPKSSFTETNTAFNWGSCNLEVTLTPVSSSGTTYLAKVAIDNIRMLKSPPVIAYSTSTAAKSNLLFWGSGAPEKKKEIRRSLEFGPKDIIGPGTVRVKQLDHVEVGNKEEEDEMQLEGLKQIADPLPSGTWYYKTTFLKESPSGFEIESNPSFQSSGWIVSNEASSWTYLGITNIPVAPQSFGVAGRRIYRRKSNENTMRHVYTLHDNQTTTFFDTVPNVTLGHALEEDHDPPPYARFMYRGSDQRMYYFNVSELGETYHSRVRISKPYEPYYCPLGNTFDLSPDDGTEGTGIFEYQGVMHFLKERSTWYMQRGPVNANPSVGCVAPRSVAVGRNEVFWLSDQGPIKYNMRFHNINHSVDGRSLYRIQPILDRLPKAYIKNAVGTFFDGYYLLAVTDSGSTVNNLVLCYDVDNDVWTTFPNLQVNCWASWTGYKDGYRLFFGNYSGQICEMFAGDYDVSTPIYWNVRSKEFGIPTPQEYFRKSYWFVENLDGNGKNMTVQPYYDFTQVSTHSETVLISGTYNLAKTTMPGNDAPSFFSIGASGSGRIKINVAELYAAKENVR